MKQYLKNILTAISQLLNSVLAGNPDQTISGRVGYKAYITRSWYWLFIEWGINTLFWFDPEHCFKSIQWDRIK